MKLKHIIIAGLLFFISINYAFAQQDAQFTQYMYNTMGVNSAYAGNRGHLTVTALHRTQWVGIDGAPVSQTLGIDSPIGKNVGLGLSVINDKLGPLNETYFDLNFSYTVNVSDVRKLSFGVKGGARLFDIDWSKGRSQTSETLFQENISRFLPTIGAGVYYHTDKSYIGFSVPNLLTDLKYDDVQQEIDSERIHLFLIGGLIMDLSENTKFKPAFLLKSVKGAPLILDLSANFMFHENFRLGASYRWDDSLGAQIGFQLGPKLLVGYAYDHTLTELQAVSSGTHEIMLRFELSSALDKIKSPRFF